MTRRINNPKSNEPRAHVRQIDRTTWVVEVYSDQNWHVMSAYARTERAIQRKAERLLVKWKRKYGDLNEGFVIQ